jgi:hypothetical protein
MSTKADYSDDEWARLKRAPFIAGMAISLADPGGPVEAVKETSATLKAVLATAQEGDGLPAAIARDAAADVQARHNPMSGFKPKGATAGVEILAELRAIGAIVADKGGAQDLGALREWLTGVAQRAADAAKEGGFMGFHAERVSAGEKQMLESVREALA